jgi:hypothetical protein
MVGVALVAFKEVVIYADKLPMAVAGRPRQMKVGCSSGRRRCFLVPELADKSEVGASGTRTVAASTRLRFPWQRLLRMATTSCRGRSDQMETLVAGCAGLDCTRTR